MRLIIVANREPLREEGGRWLPSVGGLTTALLPVLEKKGGVWIAWGEKKAKELPKLSYPEDEARFTVQRLYLSKAELAAYYYGFANRVLWPLCHYFMAEMSLRRDFFKSYGAVNRRFARRALEAYEEGDTVWVQDYQLMLVPDLIRKERPESRIGFFFHIPWPAAEVWKVLSWAKELTEGLLGADLIGFHSQQYVKNFLEAVTTLTDAEVEGGRVRWQGREIRVEAHPIGIDTARFRRLSERRRVRAEVKRIREEARSDFVLLGVDRLDYTKGILDRLLAFECFLQTHPDYRGKVTFYQIAAPSRTRVKSYLELKRAVDEVVGRINGEYMKGDWVPVRYIYHSLPPERLAAFYLAADAALVTPLRDGMNLIAQEFAWTSEQGVLILSELTGAAEVLEGALLINPYNIDGVVATIKAALTMPEEERRDRLTRLKAQVKELDVHRWAEGFLSELEA
ncbi:trehalose-6-phosphate synthase [soil metagenome]